MGKAIIYARISPRRNGEQSESIPFQLERCRKWCDENNLEVCAEYTDEGFSGDDADRPGLWAAVDGIRRGMTLVVWKRDRIARNVYISELVAKLIRDQRGQIEATDEEVTGSGPEQDMIRQILAAVSQYEKRMIALRTKHAMQRHQREGRVMSSQPPYGYHIVPCEQCGGEGGNCSLCGGNGKRLEEHPEEQDTVRVIMLMREAGAHYRLIARAMKTERCRGAKWCHRTIQRIVEREEQRR